MPQSQAQEPCGIVAQGSPWDLQTMQVWLLSLVLFRKFAFAFWTTLWTWDPEEFIWIWPGGLLRGPAHSTEGHTTRCQPLSCSSSKPWLQAAWYDILKGATVTLISWGWSNLTGPKPAQQEGVHTGIVNLPVAGEAMKPHSKLLLVPTGNCGSHSASKTFFLPERSLQKSQLVKCRNQLAVGCQPQLLHLQHSHHTRCLGNIMGKGKEDCTGQRMRKFGGMGN